MLSFTSTCIIMIGLLLFAVLLYTHCKQHNINTGLNESESFTNSAGYFADQNTCDSMTLRDCLNTSTCGWCISDNFAPKCVPGTASDLVSNGMCKKVYANDAWTRAVVFGDNNYRISSDDKTPLFE